MGSKVARDVYGDGGSGTSAENRAGWLATISEVFTGAVDKASDYIFGDDEQESTASTTPSSTYDEVPATAVVTTEVETEMPDVNTDLGINTDLDTVAVDVEDLEAIITREASIRNIDPEIAIRLWRAEGNTSYQSDVEREGSGSLNGREASFGPFQLFTGGGLGNDYERLTGRELVNDNTLEGVTKQIQFALDMAASRGWTPWYGRITAGIGERDGLADAVPVYNWRDS
jgi:hypothetical protein